MKLETSVMMSGEPLCAIIHHKVGIIVHEVLEFTLQDVFLFLRKTRGLLDLRVLGSGVNILGRDWDFIELSANKPAGKWGTVVLKQSPLCGRSTSVVCNIVSYR